MNHTILFTPVGGTDPISMNNYHDGSMLHICRIYKPDKVIMYMSKEMLDNQEADDRYRYCLDKLAELQNRKMEYGAIERRNLTNVHEFDYFYQDFRGIIEKIYANMDETDTLLLNISSGTPAMKSGLAVLKTLGEFPAKLIQVETPERKMNEHNHKGYDVELLWELNEDNQENCENRCKEIFCPTLSGIKTEEIIKKHLKVYDYQAAVDAAETLPEEETAKYKDLLYLAMNRLLLNFPEVDKLIKKTNFQCLPVRTSSERKYFEYALNMEVRLKRGEYAEYIRAISPLIVDLFELVLKKQCKIVVDDYCRTYKKDGIVYRRWDVKKLSGTAIGTALEEYYATQGQSFNAKDVYSVHLKILVEAFSKDTHLIELFEAIRSVEGSIRNLAAHEIVSVTDETIKKMTGYTGKQIMDLFKELFNYTGINIRKEYWDSYDVMNAKILECI